MAEYKNNRINLSFDLSIQEHEIVYDYLLSLNKMKTNVVVKALYETASAYTCGIAGDNSQTQSIESKVDNLTKLVLSLSEKLDSNEFIVQENKTSSLSELSDNEDEIEEQFGYELMFSAISDLVAN